VGAFWSEPTHDDDRASDAPVAILLDTGACLFAVHGVRFGEARQDRFHSAAVRRRSFSRSEAPSFDLRCAALAPPFRAAIAHPVPRRLALRELLLGSRTAPLLGGTIRAGILVSVVLRTPPAGVGFFVAYGSLRHA